MSAFLYPGDLVNICKNEWERVQKRLTRTVKASETIFSKKLIQDRPPFPSDSHLLELLETVYHLSFLVEEGRRVAVRVIYVPPLTFERDMGLNLQQMPARLQQPVPFSVGELLKLAPAVQATESAFTVAPAETIKVGSEDRLMIWGVLHLGIEWWRVLAGGGLQSVHLAPVPVSMARQLVRISKQYDSAAMCPPNCLTISSFAPGAVSISTFGTALARLRNGKLIGMPLPELDKGPIGSFLDPAAKGLHRDTTKALRRSRYARQSDSDRHPFELYYQTVARLLHLVREQRHGGTLLLLPDEIVPEDARLADRLSIKYRLEIPPVWNTLIDEGVANSHYCRLRFSKPHYFLSYHKSARASELKELIRWEENLERAQERIAKFCTFVAALSAVDGAVVMSRKMRVLGFGAEIIATSPSLSAVKEALDPGSTKTALVPLERFGTRHRSAMRMCSSFEDCIALVVSQDGSVRVMKRVGGDVVMWNDVSLGRFAI